MIRTFSKRLHSAPGLCFWDRFLLCATSFCYARQVSVLCDEVLFCVAHFLFSRKCSIISSWLGAGMNAQSSELFSTYTEITPHHTSRYSTNQVNMLNTTLQSGQYRSREDHEFSTHAWGYWFRDEGWFETISKYDNYPGPPMPALVGYSSKYLALIISDWSGDSWYDREQLFKSFREQDYEYDEALSEIRFKGSENVLHIGDAVKCKEWIEAKDPRKLFRRYKRDVETFVLYYGDDCLYRIGPDQIGGIESYAAGRKKRVKYICSIPLKWGNGEPVFRVIQRLKPAAPLVSKRTTDIHGRKWVTRWRLAAAEDGPWHIED